MASLIPYFLVTFHYLVLCSQIQCKNTTKMQGGIIIIWEGERWESIHTHTTLIKVCCSDYSVLLLVCALSGFSRRTGLIEWTYITNKDLSGWLLWYSRSSAPMAICRLRGWEPGGCWAYEAEEDPKLMLQAWKSPGESQVSVHVERAQGLRSDVSGEWEQHYYNRMEHSSARSRGKCCMPYDCFVALFLKRQLLLEGPCAG